MKRNGILVLKGKETTITCREGTLWVTWKNSPDVILKQGESLRIPRGRKIYMESYTE